MKTIEEQFIDVIIDKVKAGWFWVNIIRMALTKGIDIAMQALTRRYPVVADEIMQLMLRYIDSDERGMIDEAADLLAEIVKLIFYPTRPR